MLRKASELGRTLIVLLNSDTAVLTTKGYLGEQFFTRKANLLATGLVDEVIGFGTNPTFWLDIIRPDVFLVGDDHSMEEIMDKGGQFVKRIVIVPRTPDISSSEIYRKRKDEH
jgi:bifunctional ADP-heptose synthase (sugar kinase/adenylyltransferase)